VIFTVKLTVPAAVGVPEIAPALLRESPAGSEEPLAKAHVTAPAPPLDCNAAERSMTLILCYPPPMSLLRLP
jgi:hypothetical protein